LAAKNQISELAYHSTGISIQTLLLTTSLLETPKILSKAHRSSFEMDRRLPLHIANEASLIVECEGSRELARKQEGHPP
jgi:hypothetical protein